MMIGKQRGCLVMLRKLDFECELMYRDGPSHSPRRARALQAALVAGLVLQVVVLFSTLLLGQGSNTALVRPNKTVN